MGSFPTPKDQQKGEIIKIISVYDEIESLVFLAA